MPVLVEDAAEAVASVDVKPGGARFGDGCRQRAQWPGVADPLVRPVGVVELLELAKCAQQVRLVPDQGAVEQLATAGLHPPLHERVHPRHLDPAEHDLDASILEHVGEHAGELAVAIPDQEPRPVPGALKIHDQVPRGLGNPGCGGMRSRTQDPDPPGGVLDDRQHVQPCTGQRGGLEEVARNQRLSLRTEELAQVVEVRPGAGSIPA